MQSLTLPTQYKHCCRSCFKPLTSTEILLSNIFQIFVGQTCLAEMYTACTQLAITLSDNLPDNICQLCETSLIGAFEFRTNCIESDRKFRAALVAQTPIPHSTFTWVFVDEKPDAYLEPVSSLATESNKEKMEKEQTHEFKKPFSTTTESNKKKAEKELTQPFSTPTESNKEKMDKELTHEFKKPSSTPNKKTKKPPAPKSNHKYRTDNTTKYKFACEFCDRSFQRRFSIEHHLTTVHNQPAPTIECNICKGLFYSEFGLKQHGHLVHGTKSEKSRMLKVYKCTDCDQTFASHFKFHDHMNKNHGGARKYPCIHCDEGDFEQI